MTRRTGRLKEINSSDRQRLVDLSYQVWSACSDAMRSLDTRCGDYDVVLKLQADALAFGKQMAPADDDRMRFGGPGLMSRVPDLKDQP